MKYNQCCSASNHESYHIACRHIFAHRTSTCHNGFLEGGDYATGFHRFTLAYQEFRELQLIDIDFIHTALAFVVTLQSISGWCSIFYRSMSYLIKGIFRGTNVENLTNTMRIHAFANPFQSRNAFRFHNLRTLRRTLVESINWSIPRGTY